MNDSFSAWRVGAPYYVPLFVVGVGAAIGLGPFGYSWVGALILGVAVFVLCFFRDPNRAIPGEADAVVSPADGVVVAVEDLEESPHYEGACRRISIFLSVFNVHVNRSPFDGTTAKVIYQEGRFINAMSAESSQVNESNAVWVDTPAGPMTIRQISGAVARRIVCLPKAGETLKKGQKIGMIKFGSRTELYLPAGTEVCVAPKQKVKGGTSIVARVPSG